MIQLAESCDKCDWGSPKNTSISCMCGVGPMPADIMIIGDKPWKSDVKVTKNLVIDMLSPGGMSILINSLSYAGLKLSECYLTNVMHCSAPEDADPSLKEIKACMYYLREEIALVKPKYVLLLGSTTLKAVLGKAGLKELHGSVIEQDGIKYMPTFHPHLVFREPAMLELIENDIKKFALMVKGNLDHFKPKLNIQIVKDYEALSVMLKDIESVPVVAYDLETSNLDMYAENKYVNCLGVATGNAQWIVPLEFKDSPWKGKRDDQLTILHSILSCLKGKKVVGHNAKFDNKWLKAAYGLRFPLTFDTMLAMHLLDDETRLGLKYLAKRFFNAPDYDIKEKEKMGDTDADTLYTYCATDLYYTLKLYEMLKTELNKQENASVKNVFKHIVMPLSDALEIVEENGVYINIEQYNKVAAELKAKRELLKIELDKYASGVNWNSTQQVGRVLYNDWGLRVIQKTAKGAPSTGEAVLKQLKSQHPGVEKLLEYRAVNKTISAFIEGWKPFIHPDNRMHPTFNVFGTASGRLSCNDPNLQQVPKDTMIRNLVTAPQGWTFIEADYSQLELRVIAMVSGDRVMNQVYKEGKIDLHTKTASIITGKPTDQVTKKERSEAKPVNFGLSYGMGWRTLIEYARTNYEIEFDDQRAQRIRNDFFNAYPDLLTWHDRQRDEAHRNKSVKTMTGRIRKLPGIDSSDKQVVAQAERIAINTPIQSFGSDICVSALIELTEKLDRDKVKIVGNIHDALLFEVRNDALDETIAQIKSIMENPTIITKKFGIKFSVPILVEVVVAKDGWGSGK